MKALSDLIATAIFIIITVSSIVGLYFLYNDVNRVEEIKIDSTYKPAVTNIEDMGNKNFLITVNYLGEKVLNASDFYIELILPNKTKIKIKPTVYYEPNKCLVVMKDGVYIKPGAICKVQANLSFYVGNINNLYARPIFMNKDKIYLTGFGKMINNIKTSPYSYEEVKFEGTSLPEFLFTTNLKSGYYYSTSEKVFDIYYNIFSIDPLKNVTILIDGSPYMSYKFNQVTTNITQYLTFSSSQGNHSFCYDIYDSLNQHYEDCINYSVSTLVVDSEITLPSYVFTYGTNYIKNLSILINLNSKNKIKNVSLELNDLNYQFFDESVNSTNYSIFLNLSLFNSNFSSISTSCLFSGPLYRRCCDGEICFEDECHPIHTCEQVYSCSDDISFPDVHCACYYNPDDADGYFYVKADRKIENLVLIIYDELNQKFEITKSFYVVKDPDILNTENACINICGKPYSSTCSNESYNSAHCCKIVYN